MTEFLEQKCLLVCDYECFPILFRLKGEHPGAEWKILRKDDLLDRVSFSFAKDPIPYLMGKQIDYSNGKKYLRLLRVADYEKNARLKVLYDDLKTNGFIKVDPLASVELSRSKVVLLEMQEDEEIHALLARKGIAYTDVTLEQLGAEKKLKDGEHPPLLSFPNKFAQYFYIYSQIRKELREDESLRERISILINDESDLYYIKTVSSLFKLPSFAVFLRPFLSNPAVKKKTADIYQSKSFVFTEEEKEDSDLGELLRIVNYYGLPSLPFDFAYASLLEIANTLGVKEQIDDKGITIENRYTLDPSARIFVTNFQYDAFYKVFDDKNVLTDQELTKVSANPSYVRTKMDRRKKLNYLLYNDIAMLSRVRQHLTDKIYDSPFLEELGWSSAVKVGMNPDGVYTTEAGHLYLADQLDKQFYPFRFGEYRNYDHSYKGIEKPIFDPKKNWSVTNLEGYIKCPFQYYLNNVVPDQDGDKHAMWLGTLVHSVMERVLHDDFDFEKEFANGALEYKQSMLRSNQTYTAKEEVWLEMAKYWLKFVVSAIQKSKTIMHYAGDLAEEKVTFKLQGNNGVTYTFANAKIDKILFTEFEGEKFYTIIDYKSGKENFVATQVFLGPSCQLPLYYFAIENSPNKAKLTNGGTFGSFGISHTFASSPKKFAADGGETSFANVVKTVRSRGVSRNYVPYWQSLDPTGLTKDGKNVTKNSSTYFGKGLLFNTPDEPVSIIPKAETNPPYNLDQLVEEAKKAMVETIEKITKNEFPIAPTSSDLGSAEPRNANCKFCPYGDICYKNLKQDMVSYENDIKAHFYPHLMTDEEASSGEEEDDE